MGKRRAVCREGSSQHASSITAEPSDSQQHFAPKNFAACGGRCWANKEWYAGKSQARLPLISRPSYLVPNSTSLEKIRRLRRAMFGKQCMLLGFLACVGPRNFTLLGWVKWEGEIAPYREGDIISSGGWGRQRSVCLSVCLVASGEAPIQWGMGETKICLFACLSCSKSARCDDVSETTKGQRGEGY